jgi:hypothetical protein
VDWIHDAEDGEQWRLKKLNGLLGTLKGGVLLG